MFISILLVSFVSAAPPLPTEFLGGVSIDGQPAPLNTEIIAKINGKIAGSIKTNELGKYGSRGTFDKRLTVSATEEDTNQTIEIEFFVNGVQVGNKVSYLPGMTRVLDISVGTSNGVIHGGSVYLQPYPTANTTTVPTTSSSSSSGGGSYSGGSSSGGSSSSGDSDFLSPVNTTPTTVAPTLAINTSKIDDSGNQTVGSVVGLPTTNLVTTKPTVNYSTIPPTAVATIATGSGMDGLVLPIAIVLFLGCLVGLGAYLYWKKKHVEVIEEPVAEELELE